MQQLTLREQIDRKVGELPVDLQRRVLNYITQLDGTGLPPGVPGRELVKLAGTLSKKDADELKTIIEEGCEKVDLDEW